MQELSSQGQFVYAKTCPLDSDAQMIVQLNNILVCAHIGVEFKELDFQFLFGVKEEKIMQLCNYLYSSVKTVGRISLFNQKIS